jgi:hypothetical protein
MVEGDEIDLTDGRSRVRIRVMDVETGRPYSKISEEEAVADGVNTLQELDADLRRFYGPLDPEQPMTLIHFEVDTSGQIVDQPQLFG